MVCILRYMQSAYCKYMYMYKVLIIRLSDESDYEYDNIQCEKNTHTFTNMLFSSDYLV